MLAKFGALLCALLLATLGIVSPSSATHDIPDEFEVSGWWNTGSPTPESPSRKWTYHKFPITCNTNAALPAFQVLWVTKPGQTVDLDDPAKLDVIRNDFNRIASIFAASAKKVLSSDAALLTDKTPRFVTWQTAGGRCHPIFERVQVSASIYDAGYSSIWNALRTGNNSNAKTYNAANRKYLSVTQTIPANDTYAGIAENPGYYDGADKTTGNAANSSSHLLVVSNAQHRGEDFGWTGAHEMGHALGALAQLAPHNNLSAIMHPTDCLEVMCYQPIGDTPGQVNVCGLSNYSNPEAYRLDCGKDDYFNNSPGPANYLATHFNVSTESTYIWGGGAVSGFAPPAPPPSVHVETPHAAAVGHRH